MGISYFHAVEFKPYEIKFYEDLSNWLFSELIEFNKPILKMHLLTINVLVIFFNNIGRKTLKVYNLISLKELNKFFIVIKSTMELIIREVESNKNPSNSLYYELSRINKSIIQVYEKFINCMIKLCNNILKEIFEIKNLADLQKFEENFVEIKSFMKLKINEIKSDKNLSFILCYEFIEVNESIFRIEKEIVNFFIKLCNNILKDNILKEIFEINDLDNLDDLESIFIETKNVMALKINKIKSDINLYNALYFELIKIDKLVFEIQRKIEFKREFNKEIYK